MKATPNTSIRRLPSGSFTVAGVGSRSVVTGEFTKTVCSACETEACWQGLLYCEDYKTAGTKEVPR